MHTPRFWLWAALVAALAVASSPAETLRLEGEAFRPDAPVVWSASTKDLPANFVVYDVVPKQFSNEIISRMLEIADFKTVSMKLSPDKKTMQWRAHDENGTLIRSLDITPSAGWITYFNTKTEAPSGKPAEGVPTFDEAEKLAMNYSRQLGGETNQLSSKPAYRSDNHRTLYNRKGGDVTLDDFTIRGIMYCRHMDGVRINGTGGCGGLWIEFGNHAKVARLNLNWRNLQPGKRYQTASPKEIIRFIKAGQATLPEQDADLSGLPQAKKFTVTKITPYYWGDTGGADQKWAYPFAELEVKADLPDGNAITFALFCPILTDKVVEGKTNTSR